MRQFTILCLFMLLSACNTTSKDRSSIESRGAVEASPLTTDAAFLSSLKQAFEHVEEFDETPGFTHVTDNSKLPPPVQKALRALPDGESFTWKFKNTPLFVVIGFSPVFNGQIFDAKGKAVASGQEVARKFVWNN